MKVVVQNSDGQWDSLFASQFNFFFLPYTHQSLNCMVCQNVFLKLRPGCLVRGLQMAQAQVLFSMSAHRQVYQKSK